MVAIFIFLILFVFVPWSQAETKPFHLIENKPSAIMSDMGCFQNLSHLEEEMEEDEELGVGSVYFRGRDNSLTDISLKVCVFSG